MHRHILLRLLILALILFHSLWAQIENESSPLWQKDHPVIQTYLDSWTGWQVEKQRPLSVLFVQILSLFPNQQNTPAQTPLGISLFIYNNSGNLVHKEYRNFVPEFAGETWEHFPFSQYLMRVPLDLAPGNYRALVKISSAHSVIHIKEHRFTIPPLQKMALPVSSIIFFSRQRLEAHHSDAHHWQAFYPFPARQFGKHVPRAYFYFEAYPQIKSPARIHIFYETPEGHKHLVKNVSLPQDASYFTVLDSLETRDLPPGRYTLQIELIHPRGESEVLAQSFFRVEQDPEDLRFHTRAEILENLQYMGSSPELEFLHQAPLRTFPALLESFWKKYDPNPVTPFNEARYHFYNRLEYALQHYSLAGKLTDRGKIYLIYGQPEGIEHQEDPISQQRLEIWDYRQLHLKIVFQDVSGLGEFRFRKAVKLTSSAPQQSHSLFEIR